jgi:TfuA protein
MSLIRFAVAILERFEHFDRFLILDGEFAQNLSVSPKEILRLLDAGKEVVGAASMGALRVSYRSAASVARQGPARRTPRAQRARTDHHGGLVTSHRGLHPRSEWREAA